MCAVSADASQGMTDPAANAQRTETRAKIQKELVFPVHAKVIKTTA